MLSLVIDPLYSNHLDHSCHNGFRGLQLLPQYSLLRTECLYFRGGTRYFGSHTIRPVILFGGIKGFKTKLVQPLFFMKLSTSFTSADYTPTCMT